MDETGATVTHRVQMWIGDKLINHAYFQWVYRVGNWMLIKGYEKETMTRPTQITNGMPYNPLVIDGHRVEVAIRGGELQVSVYCPHWATEWESVAWPERAACRRATDPDGLPLLSDAGATCLVREHVEDGALTNPDGYLAKVMVAYRWSDTNGGLGLWAAGDAPGPHVMSSTASSMQYRCPFAADVPQHEIRVDKGVLCCVVCSEDLTGDTVSFVFTTKPPAEHG